MLLGFALFANLLVTTQLLQLPPATGFGIGLDTAAAGLALAPSALMFGIMAPVAAGLTRRAGAEATLLVGAAGMAAAYVARIALSHQLWQIVAGSVLVAAGTSLTFAAMPTLIIRAVPVTETASANGLNTLLRSVGTSSSSAATAAVTTMGLQSIGGAWFPSFASLAAVFWIAAGGAAVAAVIAVVLWATRQPGAAAESERIEQRRHKPKKPVRPGQRNMRVVRGKRVPTIAVPSTVGEFVVPGSQDNQWDEIFDVVVVGSGGGALTAALLARDGGASVLVVEKDQYLGGTTAVSGGDMWIPNNHHIAGKDSREDAIAYVHRLSDGRESDPSLVEVYVDTAPQALDYLEAHTGYRSEPHVSLDDYYSVIGDRIPGVRHFPRTVAVKPYPAGAELGELAKLINKGPWVPPVEVSFPEQRRGEVGPEELARREREGWRAKGGGLIAALLKALLDRGVEVRTSTPAVELVTDDQSAVVGTVVDGAGGRRRIGARKGVVLACGGFEWNPEMVKTYIGYEVKPVTPWSNTGDGHLMAMEAGAKMGSMTSFFSYGVMYDPWEKGRDGNPLPQMMMGLGAGSILVNKLGRRFMHGGYTYNDFSHPFGFYDQRYPGFVNKPPAWVIFGAEHLEQGIMGAKPGIEMSLTGPEGQEPPDWVVLAGSIGELAQKIGIDPDSLQETVNHYNEYAEKGEDPDWSDPLQTHVLTGPDSVNHKPVVGPPYGAIQQWPGTIGTNGGCRIDADARVLGNRVPVIDGLYAAGNTSAAVLGATYPGGGTCIGSSVTMGYRAGRHVAGRAPRDIG